MRASNNIIFIFVYVFRIYIFSMLKESRAIEKFSSGKQATGHRRIFIESTQLMTNKQSTNTIREVAREPPNCGHR